jgi:hypothetical protein
MNSDVLNRLVLASRQAAEALAPSATPENRHAAKLALDQVLTDVQIDADFRKQTDPEFDGETYDPALDKDRLNSQLGRVFDVMQDGYWRTLGEIDRAMDILNRTRDEGRTNTSEASISARLRDLRKPRFGGYLVERRARDRERGLYEYRMLRADGTCALTGSYGLEARQS